MKTKTSISGLMIIFSSFLLCSLQKLQSQTITLSGPEVVSPRARETYLVASFYEFNSNTIITWTVTGGSIYYQVTDPRAASIYCIVEWNNFPGHGYISFNESINGGHADKGIYITNYPVTVSKIIFPSAERPLIDCTPLPGGQCNFLQNINFI